MRQNLLILSLMVLALAACTKVEVLPKSAPPVARVVCQTDWSDIASDDALAASKPAKVTLAATRVVRAVHTLASGIYTNVISDPDTLSMEPGEYRTLLYTATPRSAYTWVNQSAFEQDDNVSLRSITAELVAQDKEKINKRYPGFYGPLYSGGFAPVDAAAPLFTAQQQTELVDGVQTLVFKPRQLAQQITFRVHIKYGEKLEPGRVVANITGVPFRVELLSGYVQVDTLGQTFFPMKKVSDTAEEGATFEGTVSLLGIYPPGNDQVKLGPGMLKVCIEAGPMKRKALQIVNLYSHLHKLEPALMEYTNIEGFYTKGNRSSALIDVETVVELDSSESTGDNPIWEWVDNDGDVNPLTDGDNSEEPGDNQPNNVNKPRQGNE